MQQNWLTTHATKIGWGCMGEEVVIKSTKRPM